MLQLKKKATPLSTLFDVGISLCVFAATLLERDVRVKVNAVTAGIRGTDVWGKSESDRDIVCLLEGRIDVSHGPAGGSRSAVLKGGRLESGRKSVNPTMPPGCCAPWRSSGRT